MDELNRMVILLANDLMLLSSISGYVQSAGLTFRSVSSQLEVVPLATQNPAALLLVDLGSGALDLAQLAAQLPPQMLQQAVAYGPHVHVDRLQAAEEAGFGHVMSRGQFTARVGDKIAEFAARK